MARFGINTGDLGIETQLNVCLVVEAVRTQRQPILWCAAGKIILGQVRTIDWGCGITAQHDDTAAKLPPPQHLRRGEATRRSYWGKLVKIRKTDDTRTRLIRI